MSFIVDFFFLAQSISLILLLYEKCSYIPVYTYYIRWMRFSLLSGFSSGRFISVLDYLSFAELVSIMKFAIIYVGNYWLAIPNFEKISEPKKKAWLGVDKSKAHQPQAISERLLPITQSIISWRVENRICLTNSLVFILGYRLV